MSTITNLYCTSMTLFCSQRRSRLHFVIPISPNGLLSLKNVSRVKAALVSEDGDIISYPNNNRKSTSVEIQPDTLGFGTLAAEITPTNSCFSCNDDEYDLDRPTEGFASIPEAIEDICRGKLVIVMDDEDRKNEGDLIMAASLVTPEAMAFIVKLGNGIVCVSMKDRLREATTSFDGIAEGERGKALNGIHCNAKCGPTTGVSACDRATTILALASKDSKPEDFKHPGHIFPLKYREGGVLKRAGYTEASAGLAVLDGLEPVAVLCEIVDDDGSMARLPKLCQFAQAENLQNHICR